MASLAKWHDRLLRPLMSPRQRLRMLPGHMKWLERAGFTRAQLNWGGVTGIPDHRCFFLQSALQSLAGVPGDIAECGVRHGKSTLFLAEVAEGRPMHVFDSFEGLSDADPQKDPGVETRRGGKRKFANRNLSAVLKRFETFPNITVHQGWIPDRFPEVADRRFAFVHVDVDMYQPTLDAIRFFYPRMSPGAILVCDDYGSSRFPGAETAMHEALEGCPEGVVELPSGQAFFVKRG